MRIRIHRLRHREGKRISLGAAISALIALISGVYLLSRLVARRKKTPAVMPIVSLQSGAAETAILAPIADMHDEAVQAALPLTRRMLLRLVASFGCLATAQAGMLIFKTPTTRLPEGTNAILTTIAPLILFPLGAWLALPAVIRAADVVIVPQAPLQRPFTRNTLSAVLLLMGVALFMLLQTPTPITPLPDQAAFFEAAATGTIYTDDTHGPLYALFFSSFSAGDSAAGFRIAQTLSAIFALLLIPCLYLLGQEAYDKRTGIVTAGFGATALWTLGIAKSASPYALLACIGALGLWLLLRAYRTHATQLYLAAALLIGTGISFTPLATYGGLLLIVPLVLALLRVTPDEFAPLPLFRRPVVTIPTVVLPAFGLLLLVAAIFSNSPGAPRPRFDVGAPFPEPPPYAERVGYSQPYAILDGAFQTLLALNLTSDPTPFTGAVNRPVVSPLVSAAFALGGFALIWRIAWARRGEDLIVLLAVMISVLPSALLIEPPIRTPHMGRAALALPVLLLIAAQGVGLIADLALALIKGDNEHRQTRLPLASLFVILLVFAYTDAVDHYSNVAFPAYEEAANAYMQLFVTGE